MREQNPHLNVTTDGDATIVAFTDRKILDEINISQIGEQLNALVARPSTPKLVLDFAAVSHMSSSALGMLITIHKRIRERNGQLRLCAIQPAIFEVFVITRLNEILKITADQKEALESLRSPA
jgi:anti-sigma B factor antagonist